MASPDRTFLTESDVSDPSPLRSALDAKAGINHASRHAVGGADPLTPADIGALETPGGTPMHSGLILGLPIQNGLARTATGDPHVDTITAPGTYRIGGGYLTAANGYPWCPGGSGTLIVTTSYSSAYVTQLLTDANGRATWTRSWVTSVDAPPPWTPLHVDTGWRVLPLEGGGGFTGAVKVKRINDTVYVSGSSIDGTASTNGNVCVLPAGFNPGVDNPSGGVGNPTSNASPGNVGVGAVGGGSNEIVRAESPSSWTGGWFSFHFATDNNFPDTLPGTPA